MVNRRKFDIETGNDIHLTGQEVKLTLEEDINRLRTMKCYRGVRHASATRSVDSADEATAVVASHSV